MAPAQWARASSWAAQRSAWQWHAALGRGVAALVWAAACRAAKARSEARSLDRDGIRLAAVEHTTVVVRSP